MMELLCYVLLIEKLSGNTLSDFIDKTLYEKLKAEIKIDHEEIRQENVQSLKDVKR